MFLVLLATPSVMLAVVTAESTLLCQLLLHSWCVYVCVFLCFFYFILIHDL